MIIGKTSMRRLHIGMKVWTPSLHWDLETMSPLICSDSRGSSIRKTFLTFILWKGWAWLVEVKSLSANAVVSLTEIEKNFGEVSHNVPGDPDMPRHSPTTWSVARTGGKWRFNCADDFPHASRLFPAHRLGISYHRAKRWNRRNGARPLKLGLRLVGMSTNQDSRIFPKDLGSKA